MSTAAATEPARHALIPLADLRESPFNHRRIFDEAKLAELAESIQRHGMLQPVLARELDSGDYELVFGHRRARAALAAGLKEIPAIVREMDDREVLEAQLIENVQREDVHPLEEADGYKLLIGKHGYDVDALAAKLGKSNSHVYGRLKLATMAEAARDAFFGGKFNAGVAMVIARVPEHHQAEALKLVLNPGWRPDAGEQLTAREALNLIRNRLMLRLKDAPFSTKDAQLVPDAGACTDCPKRTGCQPQLFADVDEADTCTDPTCFQQKKDATWQAEREQAEAAGIRVLDDKESKKVLSHNGAHHDAPYVSLEGEYYEYNPKTGDEKQTTWKKLLGKAVKPVAIARDEHGVVHHLVEKVAAAKVLAKTAPQVAKELKADLAGSGAASDPAAAEKAKQQAERERQKRELEEALKAKLVAELIARIEKQGLNAELLRMMIEEYIGDGFADTTIERRLGENIDSQELVDQLPKMTQRQLEALAFEIATDGRLFAYSGDGAFKRAAAAVKLDVKAAKKKAEKEAKEKAMRPCIVPGCARFRGATQLCSNHLAKAKRLKMDPAKLSEGNLEQLARNERGGGTGRATASEAIDG